MLSGVGSTDHDMLTPIDWHWMSYPKAVMRSRLLHLEILKEMQVRV